VISLPLICGRRKWLHDIHTSRQKNRYIDWNNISLILAQRPLQKWIVMNIQITINIKFHYSMKDGNNKSFKSFSYGHCALITIIGSSTIDGHEKFYTWGQFVVSNKEYGFLSANYYSTCMTYTAVQCPIKVLSNVIPLFQMSMEQLRELMVCLDVSP
jgi:hypothetical protein